MANKNELLNRLRELKESVNNKHLNKELAFLDKDNSEITIEDLPKKELKFTQLNTIGSLKKQNMYLNLNLKQSENRKSVKPISFLDKKQYRLNTRLKINDKVVRLSNLAKLLKQNAKTMIGLKKFESQTLFISNLDKPNFVIDLYISIIQHKLADVQALSKDTVEIPLEVKVPKLRYNKVPTKPEELEVPKLNIPDPIDISSIREEIPMFNEDIPNYSKELVKMGYSETAVEYLEGIPNLEDCSKFVELYEEYISNLKGREKGLFKLQTTKISEIINALMLDNELDDFNEYLDDYLEASGSEYENVRLHEDLTVTYNGKVYSNMLDKVLLETNGRNFGKMGIALKGQFQGGDHVEKEIYEGYINYSRERG